MSQRRQTSFTFALLKPLAAFRSSDEVDIRKRQIDAAPSTPTFTAFSTPPRQRQNQAEDSPVASALTTLNLEKGLPLAVGTGAGGLGGSAGSRQGRLPSLLPRRNRLLLLVLLTLVALGWWTTTVHLEPEEGSRPRLLEKILPAESEKIWSPVKDALSQMKPVSHYYPVATTKAKESPIFRITILENWACHDEVTASFMQALSDTRHNLISYLRDIRFEAEKIFDSFHWRHPPFIVDNAVFGKGTPPQAVISVSCKNDVGRFSHELNLDAWADQGNTMLYCVIHDCDEWEAYVPDWEGDAGIDGRPIMKRWIEQDRVRFLTLSPHVTKCAKSKTLPYLGVPADSDIAKKVRTFVPLFEIPDLSEEDRKQSLDLSPNSVYLAVQGKLDPGRRSYTELFAGLIQRLKGERTALMSKVKLLILGASPPDRKGKALAWPAPLRGRITLGESLPYPQFYDALKRVGALLPSFSKRAYLETKASSTVAASLISGAPMVADRAILETYSYLPKECVWFREEGETELEAALRGMEGPDSALAIKEKKQCLDRLRHQIVRDNAVSLEAWLLEDLKGIQGA